MSVIYQPTFLAMGDNPDTIVMVDVSADYNYVTVTTPNSHNLNGST